MTPRQAFTGARIFDGSTLWDDHALLVSQTGTTQLVAPHAVPDGCPVTALNGGVVSPGFVDLQVNGGGGVMFNDSPDVETLTVMATAHQSLGTSAFLPTLITDTPDQTRAAITAVRQALGQNIPGICGLHLEGPHLSVARKGAHDATLVRSMTADDLAMLLEAADHIDTLMVTVAPENVTTAQITALSKAGVIVSLGHSDCVYDTAMRAFDAGAACATHLFNAMSQATAREPGLVGAALDHDTVSSGLIADGVHVHPAMIRAALAANKGPGEVFLVTDAMATAGSDITSFTLNGRVISRAGGRLTLADGTLAGADLTLPQAVRYMVDVVGTPLTDALARATTFPAALLRTAHDTAHAHSMIWLSDDFTRCRWLTDL
ncbi:N-acetylglucosamine-6-phosphate deacetylase [Roseobacter sp. GAI101]|uniref:N-acetylglucosamine-6-phosphate deacetylase n=1 Tax=Roseobacter sp. (strain GAI101) TaxID=391589 RepID=UPI00018714FA|nr:N-acetylglucosamine-6-phosphate deacetylase [Roseobacter sp. GAI101]EEB83985.1 N-acetylglucosamine-6-phosphate deacetylase [Roseobacter sp. GAI101]